MRRFKYKYSIVIPVFNNADGVQRILECNFETFRQNNCQVLVIDDGSNQEINISDVYSNVTLFRLEKNVGVSNARNFAVQKCTGEYIIFLDSDDILASNYFRHLESRIFESKSDVLSFGAVKVSVNKGTVYQDSYHLNKIMPYHFFFKNYCILSGTAIRNEVAKLHNFKNIYHEDLQYWFDVSKTWTVRAFPEVGSVRQIGVKGSLSGSKIVSVVGHFKFIRRYNNIVLSIFYLSCYTALQIYYLLRSKISRWWL